MNPYTPSILKRFQYKRDVNTKEKWKPYREMNTQARYILLKAKCIVKRDRYQIKMKT